MDVGSTLKHARIERGQYIPEVAHAAKLPAAVVKAIEANDFTVSGSPEQVRAHVTAVAVALGLDPEPLAEAAAPRITPTPAASTEPDHQATPVAAAVALVAKRPGRLLPGLIVAAAIVGLIAFVLGRGDAGAPTSTPSAEPSATVTTPSTTPTQTEPEPTETPSVEPSETVSPEPTTATPEPTATEQPTATEEPTPTPLPSELPARAEAPLTLVIEARTATSLRVSNASGTLFRGNLAAGQSRRFTSMSDTTLRVGDAAAVLVTVNGQAYDALGPAGRVLVHTLTVG